MIHKNGFTLIELLVAVVLLGILAAYATPRVLETYRNAKKDMFLTDARSVITSTKKMYQDDEIMGRDITEYTSFGEHKLNISSNDLKYCVYLDDKGNITNAKITNFEYYIEGTGDFITHTDSTSVYYGDFQNFDCDYIFNEDDLYD